VHVKSSHFSTLTPPSGAEAFEIVLHAIALQLLACCYTFPPTSSACHVPRMEQKTRPEIVTALGLHSQYRLEPAARHHARASSETALWPGLCTGPAPKDRLVEAVSLQRRSKCKSGYVPPFSASSWTDGTSSLQMHHVRRRSHSAAGSSSSSEPGFLSSLTCQPLIPKNPRRRHNTLFTNHLMTISKQNQDVVSPQTTMSKPPSIHQKSLQSLTSQPVQCMPSAVRLSRTQSAPRIASDDAGIATRPHITRKHSSNPFVGSPLDYSVEIPQIRRVLATPAASHPKTSMLVRVCRRGDLIAEREYCGKSRVDVSQLSKPVSRHVVPITTNVSESIYVRTAPPTNIYSVALVCKESSTNCFASVRAVTHVDDKKTMISPTKMTSEKSAKMRGLASTNIRLCK
jgi:hypothetical protein